MKETVIKLQIESMEQQLKMLKKTIFKPGTLKKFSDLYGIFKGKMDLSFEEIKALEYSVKGKL
jgi:uncharacterized protein YfkK (UPF0435 family)